MEEILRYKYDKKYNFLWFLNIFFVTRKNSVKEYLSNKFSKL